MKTTYLQPSIKTIDLYEEDAVMLTVSNQKVDTSSEGFEQRTKDKDLWGNEDIWK